MGLGEVSPEDWERLRSNRRKLNASTVRTIAATAGLLVLAQFFLITLDPLVARKPPVLTAYQVLFGTGFLVSATAFLCWVRWPQGRGLDLYMGFVLTEAVGLALCDLQFTGDYSTFTMILFATAMLYSAPLFWYVVAFLVIWALLLAGIWFTHPFPFGATPVATSGVLTFLGIASGIILEVRRLRTELLTIELERKNQEWKEASLRDALTGLHNRRFLFEWMEKQIALARRMDQPLSVALIDLDHFKQVNDTAGHARGDEVLKQAAQWLSETIRGSDLAARYGGEEFVLVLPETGPTEARIVLDRCLDVFRKSRVSGWAKTLTFSGGLATLRAGETLKDLLQRADDLLYQAKTAGRNRIETVFLES